MKILAIDTSNQALGVALYDNGVVVSEYIKNIKKNHSVQAMPAIEMVLKEAEIKVAGVDRIVVAKGPGSYTGVRIGVTIAKTLAWTLKKELVGVSSLAILATVGRYFSGYVSPIFDARRGQVYTGLYRFENGNLVEVIEDRLMMNDQWATLLKEKEEPILFVGNDVKLHEEIFSTILGEKAVFAVGTENNPRPAELAKLGESLNPVDIHHFVPNYIRLAEAEANWINANEK